MKENSKLCKSRIIRILFIILGSITFVLGTIGIFLPILPTVPFYLLTAFLWVKGSKKFSDWFLNSKLYKNHIGVFANHSIMVWYKEILLLVFVSALLLTTMMLLNNKVMNIIFPILIICKYLYFVFKVKPCSSKYYNSIKEEDMKKEENKELCMVR